MAGEETACFLFTISLSLSLHSLHLSQIHSALFPIRLSPTVLSFRSPIHIPSISSEPFITWQQKLRYFCMTVQRGRHVIVFSFIYWTFCANVG